MFLNLLIIVLFIIVFVFLIRKAAVIGVAVFFGGIILMLGVTVLRDQLHIPVNDFVDTSAIDDLRDKVVPVEIIAKNSVEDVLDEDSLAEDEHEYIDYDLLDGSEISKIVDNLDGKNVSKDELDSIGLDLEKKSVEEKEWKDEMEIKSKEIDKDKYEFKYKDLDDEKRKDIYNELKFYINDDRFYNKLMGMSSYVDIEYDLGNGLMYNSDEGKVLVILVDK